MAALLNWDRGSPASLFDRIQRKGFGPSQNNRSQELLNSIKHHLNDVLNSRPGGCQSALGLGVVDLNDATTSTSDFRTIIEQAILKCIESYEPRLTDITVQSLTDDSVPLLLSFHIQASVNFDNIDDAIEFNIQLDSNRRFCFNRDL